MRVLNVGSGPVGLPVPPWYEGHDVTRLDIDPRCEPDLLMDVRNVGALKDNPYDVVFCSHCLEHFYLHEVEGIVRGFYHALFDNGACDVFVPDVGALLADGIRHSLDGLLYESPAGPITVHDLLYGFAPYQREGEYHSHHSGWSDRRLGGLMKHCGFSVIYSRHLGHDLRVIGFKVRPSEERLRVFGVEVGE